MTIGLGLGLNTTLFSFFNAYVLQPLTVRDPDRLYRFTWANRSGAGHRFTWQEAQDLAKQNPAFSEVIAIDRLSFARVDGHLMLGHLVTGNYFRMLGVGASLGRTLVPEDTAPVVVLSHSAWTRKFAADPNVIGRKMLIHGYPVEVVGIARADFRGLGEVPLDYWVPIALAPLLEEGPNLFGPNQPERIDVIGRLRPGVSLKQAQAALTSWARQRTAARPDNEQADHAILRSQATILPLDPMVVAAFSPVIVGFGLVLVIACSNVANMMLARAMARQREMGIRLAMGAAQSRLIRQLLTESILLALPASAAGLWVSQQSIHWGERLLMATLPGDYLEFIMLAPLQPDGRVFVFMLAAAGLSALLFGLAPAIQATRSNVMQAARGEFTSDFRASRLRDVLVIGQVAVSVLLLIFAATLLRANHRLRGLDVGLRTAGVIELNTPDRHRAKVIRELVSQPGVQSLAAASKVPFEGSLPRIPVSPEHGELYPAGYLYTSPEYFSIFRVAIQRGRAFTREEALAGSAVAVVSQSTAQHLWGTRDPLGQTLHLAPNPRQAPSLADPRSGPPPHASVRIIGIARDAVNGWVGDGIDHTCIYFPTAVERPGNVVFARVFGDAEAARRRLDAALTASVPGTVDQLHSMDQILAGQLYPFRALYWISSAGGRPGAALDPLGHLRSAVVRGHAAHQGDRHSHGIGSTPRRRRAACPGAIAAFRVHRCGDRKLHRRRCDSSGGVPGRPQHLRFLRPRGIPDGTGASNGSNHGSGLDPIPPRRRNRSPNYVTPRLAAR